MKGTFKAMFEVGKFLTKGYVLKKEKAKNNYFIHILSI